MNNCKHTNKKCEHADRLGMCENLTATCMKKAEMRLIDANRLKRAFCNHCDGDEPCTEPCVDIGLIETAPTIDAVQVVHGEWIWEDSVCSPRTCSVCKQKFYIGRGWNFCPNCGAKMDGKEQNDD